MRSNCFGFKNETKHNWSSKALLTLLRPSSSKIRTVSAVRNSSGSWSISCHLTQQSLKDASWSSQTLPSSSKAFASRSSSVMRTTAWHRSRTRLSSPFWPYLHPSSQWSESAETTRMASLARSITRTSNYKPLIGYRHLVRARRKRSVLTRRRPSFQVASLKSTSKVIITEEAFSRVLVTPMFDRVAQPLVHNRMLEGLQPAT